MTQDLLFQTVLEHDRQIQSLQRQIDSLIAARYEEIQSQTTDKHDSKRTV